MTDILWRELKKYWHYYMYEGTGEEAEECFDEWSRYQIELIGEARDGKK